MFLYVDFTASFTKFIFFVFDNISLFIIKLIIITIIIALAIAFGIVYKFSLFGFNNTKSDAKGSLYVACSLKDNKYFYNVNYGDNYRILSVDGDEYIMKNVDTEKATNAKEVIDIIKDYFELHNGSCE